MPLLFPFYSKACYVFLRTHFNCYQINLNYIDKDKHQWIMLVETDVLLSNPSSKND